MAMQYETWVNGAQLISFPGGLSAPDRDDVLNSHLLAQVSANQEPASAQRLSESW